MQKGLYYTTDLWNSSQQVAIGTHIDLAFDPIHSDTLYISTRSEVLKYSADMLYSEQILVNDTSENIVLAQSNSWPYSLYTAIINADGSGNHVSFYKSEDRGKTFSTQSENNELGVQGTWNYAFTVDPMDNERLVFGLVDILRSTDAGENWTSIGGFGIHTDFHDLEWRNNQLFSSSDGGISHTNSIQNVSWNPWWNIGLKNFQVTYLDVYQDELMSGLFHDGTHVWSIGDESAYRIGCCDGFECFIDESNLDRYWTTQHTGFNQNSTNIPSPSSGGYWGQPFMVDPSNSQVLFYCQNRVYKYFKSTGVFLDLNLTPDTIRVNNLALYKNNSGFGYASMGSWSVLKFIHFRLGDPPVDRASFLPSHVTGAAQIGDIIVDEIDPLKLWITLNVYDFPTIYRSDDGGLSWTNVTLNLPRIPIYDVVRIQENNQIFVGTEYGVYYMNDALGEWVSISNGIGYQRVVDLDIDNGYLYAGLWGTGVWRTPLVSVCPQFVNMSEPNFPNPYTPGQFWVQGYNHVESSIQISQNIGTRLEISGGNHVRLLPGFHASTPGIPISQYPDHIDPVQIYINTKICNN